MTTIDKAIADALTAQYAARPPEGQAEVIVVKPEKDSPLETLLCLYELRKGAYDAATEAWDEYKSALTNALRAYEPDENVKTYDVPQTRMWPALTVSWQAGREYLPTELIKQHIPKVWDAFKQNTKGYWVIRKKGKRG
jgi:hypothetical protein